MPDYRFLAYDVLSGTAIGELPLDSVSFSAVLNGAGELSATVPLIGRENARTVLAATIPERTALYVERDGVLVWGGIIWTRTFSKSARSVSIQAAEWWSYLRRLPIRADLNFVSVDQLQVARTIVQTVLGYTGANIGLTYGAEVSGRLRTRTYAGFERKQAAEAVEQLAEVIDGFDFAIEVAWGVSAPQRLLVLSFPRRGRSNPETVPVFELGKNLIDYEVLDDGTQSARLVDVIGAGDGPGTLIGSATDSASIAAGFPLTVDVLSEKDISVQATLDDRAAAAVAARSGTPQFWSIAADPNDPDGPFGSWITGDDCRIRVDDDERFPRLPDGSAGYDATHRILGWSMAVGDAGESLSVTVGPKGVI
jgi:hypothetical protein